MFKNYHYLNHNHLELAHQFIAVINNEPVGFCSVLHFPHPKFKNGKRIHRLVVMPDYQGIGIGSILLNYVAQHFADKGFRMLLTTSNLAMSKALQKNKDWKLKRQGRITGGTNKAIIHTKKAHDSSSKNRITTSWEYNKKAIKAI